MNWDSKRHVAARGRRHQDRTIRCGAGGPACDVKIPAAGLSRRSLPPPSAAALLLPAAIGEAQAQRVAHDQRCQADRVGRRHGRQDRGRAHRRALHRHHGRRSRSRGRHPVDRPVAVDPRQEDRNDARVGLRRGQEAGRHLRRRGVLRHLAARRRAAPLHRRRHQGVVGQRPHHALGHRARRRDAGQGGGHRAPVRARHHQRGAGAGAPASDAGGALHRGHAPGRPRARHPVEQLRPEHARQHRPNAGRPASDHAGRPFQLPVKRRISRRRTSVDPAPISPIVPPACSRDAAVRLPVRHA